MLLIITAIVCFLASIVLTPIVKKLAISIGAVDKPNQRKVHQRIMPRLGGLAIFISMIIGFLITRPADEDISTWAILIGATIIVITGILDDRFEISPKLKLLGQILAAAVVIYGGVQVPIINLPFDVTINLGYFSIPFTLLWIVGITNAINLIDGLDGLAAGVSSIVLITIASMALFMGNMFVVVISVILLASTLGFLIYNFHPAKIFMGDTGALLLGFMISVISILGFKSITVYTFLPVIILGVPISDTFYAIIRRIVNKKPLSAPDKSHLHHCLLRLGFSHRQTVLIIYAMSAFFGIAAIVLSHSTLWVTTLIIAVVLLVVQLVAERVGLVSENYQPMLRFFRKIVAHSKRSA